MKILVIGNGGREHAIAWKLHRDDPAAELFCAPGNAGTAAIATNVPIAAKDVPGLVAWAKENRPDFTVVGPEVPLCLGVVDAFQEAGLAAFGPVKATARMEGSKSFAKSIMEKLQKKVDEWLDWIKAQEDAELAKDAPPFVRKPQSTTNKMLNQKINQQLLANHTPEEIERFFNSMQGL